MTSVRTSLHLCLCSLLLAAALAAAGCTAPSPVGNPAPSASPTSQPAVTPEGTCQFTTCHGLDLGCGVSEPRMCTMEYQLGDKCRQYAHCTIGSDGTCSLTTDPAFTTCKACVEQCSIRAGADSIAAFDCEAKC
jgi:hypothetical protein